MRVSSTWTTDQGTKYQYLVVDCCGNTASNNCNNEKNQTPPPAARQLLYRSMPEKGDCTWALLAGVEDTDKALEHWSPVYPENNRQFQKRLREIIPPQALQNEPSQSSSKVEEVTEEKKNSQESKNEEDADVASHASTEETSKLESEDAVIDPVQAILERARTVVMDMEAFTPDEMFSDYAVST